MTDAGAASASNTTQFRPLAIDGAVYFLRASLDHGEIALVLTDGHVGEALNLLELGAYVLISYGLSCPLLIEALEHEAGRRSVLLGGGGREGNAQGGSRRSERTRWNA